MKQIKEGDFIEDFFGDICIFKENLRGYYQYFGIKKVIGNEKQLCIYLIFNKDMTEIEKEMIAILYYRDCGEKHRNNIKEFIFNMIYNKEIGEDWEISKEKVGDIKNSLKSIRYEAENNLKHGKKLYLTLTND